MVLANTQAPADIAVIFEVLYDTPQGTAQLVVKDYTQLAAERGVRCQIGHRRAGAAEQRSVPLPLDEVLKVETSAAVLDGESLYVRLIDQNGHDLAATKIDEARWPRDATPTTVKTVAYWLFVP
jgi:hypothetical protein